MSYELGKVLLNAGMSAGVGAATAVVTRNPLGLSGGAGFGVAHAFLGRPVTALCLKSTITEPATVESTVSNFVISHIAGATVTAVIWSSCAQSISIPSASIFTLQCSLVHLAAAVATYAATCL